MQILSTIIDIQKIENPTTEYIESELKKRDINPLRWAIVKVSEESFTISCAYEIGE